MVSQDEILISLKPKHANEIFDGGKTVELRKRRPKIKPGTRVWIYATSPIAALWGLRAVGHNKDGIAVDNLEDPGGPNWSL